MPARPERALEEIRSARPPAHFGAVLAWLSRTLSFAVLLHWSATPCPARDYFFAIGGGPSADTNPISIEQNIRLFQRTLGLVRPDQPPTVILFSDGDSQERDVQLHVLDHQPPAALRVLTEVLGDPDELPIQYRSHDIHPLAGPATRSAWRSQLRSWGEQLRSGDRLFLYFTGHGGAARNERQAPYNTTIDLWNRGVVPMRDLTRWLDQLPADVTVVLIMVQCHSGGFAHTIFHETEAGPEVVQQVRVGFFAQHYDRAAAGCTPDIHAADYQEYSTHFWAALGGQTVSGDALPRPDFDGDTHTSLAEAHAHVTIHCDTLDIPIRSSDILAQHLAQRSASPESTQARPSSSAETSNDTRSKDGPSDEPTSDTDDERPNSRRGTAQHLDDSVVPSTTRIDTLAIGARPEDRSVLEQLPLRLGFTNNLTVGQVRDALVTTERDLRRAQREYSNRRSQYDRRQNELATDVRRVWPELHADIAPNLASLLGNESQAFVETVERLESYTQYRRAAERMTAARQGVAQAERREAQLHRILQTAVRVVSLERALATPPSAARDYLVRLLAAEQMPLTSPSPINSR